MVTGDRVVPEVQVVRVVLGVLGVQGPLRVLELPSLLLVLGLQGGQQPRRWELGQAEQEERQPGEADLEGPEEDYHNRLLDNSGHNPRYRKSHKERQCALL